MIARDMLSEPLPSQVDIRKLANKGAEIKANVPASSLPRLAGILANDCGSVKADLRFGIDEQRLKVVEGRVEAAVHVFCQRCLEPMLINVNSDIELGIVWSEEDAQRLPHTMDPLIVGEELVDLADIVQEELLLSLPFVSYHEADQCGGAKEFTSGDSAEIVEEPRENPFKMLEQLKSNK